MSTRTVISGLPAIADFNPQARHIAIDQVSGDLYIAFKRAIYVIRCGTTSMVLFTGSVDDDEVIGAHDGVLSIARFGTINQIWHYDNTLYVADQAGAIRSIHKGSVSTIAGILNRPLPILDEDNDLCIDSPTVLTVIPHESEIFFYYKNGVAYKDIRTDACKHFILPETGVPAWPPKLAYCVEGDDHRPAIHILDANNDTYSISRVAIPNGNGDVERHVAIRNLTWIGTRTVPIASMEAHPLHEWRFPPFSMFSYELALGIERTRSIKCAGYTTPLAYNVLSDLYLCFENSALVAYTAFLADIPPPGRLVLRDVSCLQTLETLADFSVTVGGTTYPLFERVLRSHEGFNSSIERLTEVFMLLPHVSRAHAAKFFYCSLPGNNVPVTVWYDIAWMVKELGLEASWFYRQLEARVRQLGSNPFLFQQLRSQMLARFSEADRFPKMLRSISNNVPIPTSLRSTAGLPQILIQSSQRVPSEDKWAFETHLLGTSPRNYFEVALEYLYPLWGFFQQEVDDIIENGSPRLINMLGWTESMLHAVLQCVHSRLYIKLSVADAERILIRARQYALIYELPANSTQPGLFDDLIRYCCRRKHPRGYRAPRNTAPPLQYIADLRELRRSIYLEFNLGPR